MRQHVAKLIQPTQSNRYCMLSNVYLVHCRPVMCLSLSLSLDMGAIQNTCAIFNEVIVTPTLCRSSYKSMSFSGTIIYAPQRRRQQRTRWYTVGDSYARCKVCNAIITPPAFFARENYRTVPLCTVEPCLPLTELSRSPL